MNALGDRGFEMEGRNHKVGWVVICGVLWELIGFYLWYHPGFLGLWTLVVIGISWSVSMFCFVRCLGLRVDRYDRINENE